MIAATPKRAAVATPRIEIGMALASPVNGVVVEVGSEVRDADG